MFLAAGFEHHVPELLHFGGIGEGKRGLQGAAEARAAEAGAWQTGQAIVRAQQNVAGVLQFPGVVRYEADDE